MRTPLEVLEAAKFRKHIHLSVGVSVPLSVQIHLSAGLKHLLAPQVGAHNALIHQYDQFCERIRWRLKFLFESGDKVDDDYDPDYEVKKETPISDFRLSYIEAGFQAGERLVLNAISKRNSDLNGLGYDLTDQFEKRVQSSLAPQNPVNTPFPIEKQLYCYRNG